MKSIFWNDWKSNFMIRQTTPCLQIALSNFQLFLWIRCTKYEWIQTNDICNLQREYKKQTNTLDLHHFNELLWRELCNDRRSISSRHSFHLRNLQSDGQHFLHHILFISFIRFIRFISLTAVHNISFSSFCSYFSMYIRTVAPEEPVPERRKIILAPSSV